MFALIVINVLLDYVQNKRLGSKGLTILFVGYDEQYSGYQHSLRLFLEKLNAGRGSLTSGLSVRCSFMRDGISISTEDKFNMMLGAIYKKIKQQVPDDLKEAVKTANLDSNEEVFERFEEWSEVVRSKATLEDSGKAFEFKQFASKQKYNQVIGKLLKLYIEQGNPNSSFQQPNRVQPLRTGRTMLRLRI